MTGWYAERTPDRSAKAVIAVTLLALLLVAAVPVALLAGLVMMLLGHLNEVWHARSVIVARGRARGRVRSRRPRPGRGSVGAAGSAALTRAPRKGGSTRWPA